MGNLKSGPLSLTLAVIAKLVDDRPAFGKGIVRVPLKGKLVDRPKGGERG